jgi:hypothetical protein
MRDAFREQLNKQMTRKEFLQWLLAAALAIFGFHNLITLLTGASHSAPRTSTASQPTNNLTGFGTRRFGR